jgi:dienelactone hydrolase
MASATAALRWLGCGLVLWLSLASLVSADDERGQSPFSEQTFSAKDTLSCQCDTNGDALACLDGLSWPASSFEVRIEPTRPDRGDALIRFSSPVDTGNRQNDLVALEWYSARDDSDRPKAAPAVVVVHESGRGMTVGRLFAQGFQQRGLHAFLLHLPHYGERRGEGQPREADNLIASIRQAVADVRRARDAVAVLPNVDASNISLQGTSLGGFVSATTAGLDRGYQGVFLMLAGGDLFDVIQNGRRDSAKVRERLEAAGLTGETLKSLVYHIEPNRLAHRYNADRTWLYSGSRDDVVPPRSSESLAKAAGLTKTHHIQMNADHYSGIIYLPFVLNHMARKISELPRAAE